MNAGLKEDALFPVILGATVHDIKNSLGTLLGLIQQMSLKQSAGQVDEVRQLEFEANRINHSLMQLLVMYKIDSRKFSLMEDEYAALDLINEAKAQQDRLSRLQNIEVRSECRDDLLCYCDYQQISNALGTVLNNAQRYTKNAVLISASEADGYLRFCIEDDGLGYPPHLLEADLTNPADVDWVSGNTGLGLYFVAAIAGFHKNRDKTGYVEIDNHSRLGGARFSLYLP
ncbi:sensor histidine kinase [Methylomonas rivi]|uniref:HAMP domain-containing histidine kinase n=1 Tax=Methylomonas rivi TaxID=2952226 RepID=A0ABT1U373_9GAMM|nr:HAMP domain-containing sensor histidine kinase [Methylomonas sp. WSC-6]MBS4051188.1 HAMP domain-containing histidine kinase [Methylomonas sp.]MCQ8128281.1 HAMP domain-containing histidine kinase [Methylomonas sp. WSC-6]